MNMEWDLINIRGDLAIIIAALATLVDDREQRQKLMDVADKTVISLTARIKAMAPAQ